MYIYLHARTLASCIKKINNTCYYYPRVTACKKKMKQEKCKENKKPFEPCSYYVLHSSTHANRENLN